MAILTNDGLNWFARYGLGISTTGFTLTARLFVNNFTPSVSSVTADFTECTIPSYVAVALVPSSWSGSSSGGLGQFAYPQLTWNFSAYAGPVQTLYGYYVTESVASKTLWADIGTPSYPVPLAGGQLNLTITFNDANLS